MKAFKFFPVILLLTIFISCKKENSSEDDKLPSANFINTSYGNDPEQIMDIYLPSGRNVIDTKVIIMIHGGAWSTGDKTELSQFVDTFKRRFPGYAIFNINYRLSSSPKNLFPTQENDVKTAVDFIYTKTAEYAISNKYVYIGASAGAQLAMLQGYKYASPVKPRAIVSFSGPTDLTDMYNNPAGGNVLLSTALASVIGKTPLQDPLLYTSSSPVNFITNSSAPTLLLYGDSDPLVRYTQAQLATNKLQTAGVVNQLVLYNGVAHIDTWSSTVLSDSFNKIQAFLTANVP